MKTILLKNIVQVKRGNDFKQGANNLTLLLAIDLIN